MARDAVRTTSRPLSSRMALTGSSKVPPRARISAA
jgi:hypothetical protein